MTYELKDYLNAINHEKKNIMDTDDEMSEKKYPPPCPRHQWSVSNAVASLWMSGRVPLRAGQDDFRELLGVSALFFRPRLSIIVSSFF